MSRKPLADVDAIAQVQLHNSVPEWMPEPAATAVRRAFLASIKSPEMMSVVLAVWPDGTWSMLGHNPDWPQPRPEQLVRAYRKAHAAGARMPLPGSLS